MSAENEPTEKTQTHSYQLSHALSQRLSNLRWLVLIFGLFMALLHQVMQGSFRLGGPPRWEAVEMVYTISIAIVAWLVLTWLHRSVRQKETAEIALGQTLDELNQANQHLKFHLHVNHRLSETQDERALADTIIDLFMDKAPAAACSLIFFDEQRRTLPMAYREEGASTIFDSQVPHYSMDEVRLHCETCAQRHPDGVQVCTLYAPPSLAKKNIQKIHCLELVRGSQTFGTISLYLEDPTYPNEQESLLLQMMAGEMTLALESQSLRTHEMVILKRMQQSRRLSNLHDELLGALSATIEALEASGGLLLLTKENSSDLELQVETGQSLRESLDLVKELARGAYHAEHALIINDLAQHGSAGVRSLLIAPVRASTQTLGSLVLWATQPNAFNCHRGQLVATVAAQAALLIENQRLSLRGEHQAAMAERARLAREIHDGLAQTLGYLKLRTAQINNWLNHGEEQQAKAALEELQRLVGEAYIDTREALDGLRLSNKTGDLTAWMQEIASEFEALSGIPVSITNPPEATLTPEVHVQLQRIVQEALSNIRKHADATRVWINWELDDYWLTLHIRDNGTGFDLNDIPLMEQHGLRIMRERAELLDADFQVTSQQDKGSEIIVRLPLTKHLREGSQESEDADHRTSEEQNERSD
jgi:two-component system nitrate/nitrite sensor histidine kinase NarX